MNGINHTTQIRFISLPPQIKREVQQRPLLVQAQRRYLQSRAPLVCNKAYWQKIVENFEMNKIDDHTLDPHINTFLDKLADPMKSIIEFGCGIGRAAAILKSRGFRNYTGIDIAERAIEIARERLPDMEFIVGDIITYGTRRKFDAAIATDVLLYLSPEEQIEALLNLSKRLKDGAPILLRWAPAEKNVENDVLLKEKSIGGEKIEGWVFLATEEYIQQLLDLVGFALIQPICRKRVTINPGTKYEKQQDYLVIYAKKAERVK